MDGFTGLDIEKSKQQIINFKDIAVSSEKFITTFITEFFDELSQKWASPNAVVFSTKYTNELSTLVQELRTSIGHVINGALEAGDTLCRANGVNYSFNNIVNVTLSGLYGYSLGSGTIANAPTFRNCRESLNNVTGMAVENVKLIRDILVAKKQEGIAKLESIPTEISFYSADGSLMSAYKTGIDTFVSRINEELDSIVTDLNSYIEKETNNIVLAKEQATQNMAA